MKETVWCTRKLLQTAVCSSVSSQIKCWRSQLLVTVEIVLALGHIQVWQGEGLCIKLEFSWSYPSFSYFLYQTSKVEVGLFPSVVFDCTELLIKAAFPSAVGIPGICLNSTSASNHFPRSSLPVICCFVCLWSFLRSSCTFLCIFHLSLLLWACGCGFLLMKREISRWPWLHRTLRLFGNVIKVMELLTCAWYSWLCL